MSQTLGAEQSYSEEWLKDFRTSLIISLGLVNIIESHRQDVIRNNLPVDFFMDLLGYGLGSRFTGGGNRELQRFYNRRLKDRHADQMLLKLANVPAWVDCIFPHDTQARAREALTVYLNMVLWLLDDQVENITMSPAAGYGAGTRREFGNW